MFEIGRKIKSLGWEYMFTLELPTYPNLVREFYKNGKVSRSIIESVVKGIKIILNATCPSHILWAPIDGAERLEEKYSGLKYFRKEKI